MRPRHYWGEKPSNCPSQLGLYSQSPAETQFLYLCPVCSPHTGERTLGVHSLLYSCVVYTVTTHACVVTVLNLERQPPQSEEAVCMACFLLAFLLLEFDSHVVHVSELENGVWSLGPKLCSIMVKQEQNLPLDLPESQLPASSIPVLNLNPLQRLPLPEEVSPSKMCGEHGLSHSSTPGGAGADM